jgi:hypothetical protein
MIRRIKSRREKKDCGIEQRKCETGASKTQI